MAARDSTGADSAGASAAAWVSSRLEAWASSRGARAHSAWAWARGTRYSAGESTRDSGCETLDEGGGMTRAHLARRMGSLLGVLAPGLAGAALQAAPSHARVAPPGPGPVPPLGGGSGRPTPGRDSASPGRLH